MVLEFNFFFIIFILSNPFLKIHLIFNQSVSCCGVRKIVYKLIFGWKCKAWQKDQRISLNRFCLFYVVLYRAALYWCHWRLYFVHKTRFFCLFLFHPLLLSANIVWLVWFISCVRRGTFPPNVNAITNIKCVIGITTAQKKSIRCNHKNCTVHFVIINKFPKHHVAGWVRSVMLKVEMKRERESKKKRHFFNFFLLLGFFSLFFLHVDEDR